MRTRDWQSIYVRPNGDVISATLSTRDQAIANTVDHLLWLAGHALKHDSAHVASYLAAVERLASSTEGDWLYVTHSGAKYLVMEGQ